MTTSAQQQGFPNVSAPLVGAGGYIQQAWLQLLISLWNRTGSGPGSSTFSSGDIKQSAVSGPQNGWLECDGSAISRATYTTLFTAIGVTYGAGDGSTTFNIPDYRGKFILGTSVSFPLGSSGGSSTVTLSTANLASHTHAIADPGHGHAITDPGHVHTSVVANSTNGTGANPGTAVAGNTGSATTGITINSDTTGITVDNAGSGTPFSILPPYSPITVLIKI